ncbi:cytochrome c oxidase subunit I [Bacillaceae bacterium S4-13-58]
MQKKGIFWDHLTTVDHKKIGILYLIGGGFFFVLAGLEIFITKIQLLIPMNGFISASTYNELLTMHGTTMIFFAAMPLLFGLMNFIIPLQIGARDVAFPFLNALGFWLFLMGGIILNVSWLVGEVPDAGWTAYAPLSTMSEGHGVDFYALGLQVSGAGSIMGAINFLVTIINMRAPGMTYLRLPLFTWTSFVASGLILLAFPALTVGLFLLMFDRLFGSHFFSVGMGGNEVIWEHLFWIFGHPEVYILVLPAFGIFSEIISTFSKKRLFGYTSMVFATVLIGFLGFMVWAHHMFTVGLGPIANAIFSISTMLIAVPTGIKIFNWLFTMWKGSITVTTPMLWSLGFIPTFTFGGMTGVMLAMAPSDYLYHDTYFVVGHFHYVIISGVVFGILGGIHYWWPKMFGYMLNEKVGKTSFWLFFVGFHLTFFVHHILGLIGMPRRYWTYGADQGFDIYHQISFVGVIVMSVGALFYLSNFFYSNRHKVSAGNDPWNGRTLEWSIPSPPPFYNFNQLPLVRGLDPLWIEKMNGKQCLSPSEPLSDIHMPNRSILPFIMALGIGILSIGIIYIDQGIFIAILGGAIILISMLLRSIMDDHGYVLPKSELESKEEQG